MRIKSSKYFITKSNFILVLVMFCNLSGYSQLRNNHWIIGFNNWIDRANFSFTDTSYNLFYNQTKMGFQGTEATISDENGNFLMSSNGVWIANANGDTMLNGTGLNPGAEVNAYPKGLLLPYANIILPFPDDTEKYVLLHHTANYDGFSYPAFDLFYTIIDITKDAGLGEVISKNNVVLSDTLNWGIAACKHANGRDWWIVVLKEGSDIVYKLLLDNQGVQYIGLQHLNVPFAYYSYGQPTFSPNGKKFAYFFTDGGSVVEHNVRIFDFDRCTGNFYNQNVIDVADGGMGWGLAFSPNSQYIYSASAVHVFQIDVNTFFVDTVATYDGFCFPNNPWCTTFLNIYLAANGKIYVTSGSGVQHIHEMNYPDSAGTACDLQQHAIYLNGVWSFRAVPNHPNYNLGCDTTSGCSCLTAVEDLKKYDFKFSVSPNPVSNGKLRIAYQLPQNQKGVFEVFDVNGRKVFTMPLPQWSTLQNVLLPDLNNGIYNCVITSGDLRVSNKIVILKQ